MTNKTLMSQIQKHKLGAFVGLAIGDAAGGVLEFSPAVSPADVDRALTFPGGGPHSLGPGQITDDTELALALADGLLSTERSATANFPADNIAGEYKMGKE